MMTLLFTMDLMLVLEKFLLIGAVISFALVVAMYTTYAERKIAA